MIFATKVNGVPCQCKVSHYTPPVPIHIYGSGIGDCLAPEPGEFEYEILDRRGTRARWLEKYITPAVDERLAEEHAVMQMADYYGH